MTFMDGLKKSFQSKGMRLLLMLVGLGAVATLYRMAAGLGMATNLTDDIPWGLWVAVDVLSGVALAAGGFSITAAVYIFNMKKYKPIARRRSDPSSATPWSLWASPSTSGNPSAPGTPS
jgi:Ni/Fe-hydrogenase subunit HybB-like protein